MKNIILNFNYIYKNVQNNINESHIDSIEKSIKNICKNFATKDSIKQIKNYKVIKQNNDSTIYTIDLLISEDLIHNFLYNIKEQQSDVYILDTSILKLYNMDIFSEIKQYVKNNDPLSIYDICLKHPNFISIFINAKKDTILDKLYRGKYYEQFFHLKSLCKENIKLDNETICKIIENLDFPLLKSINYQTTKTIKKRITYFSTIKNITNKNIKEYKQLLRENNIQINDVIKLLSSSNLYNQIAVVIKNEENINNLKLSQISLINMLKQNLISMKLYLYLLDKLDINYSFIKQSMTNNPNNLKHRFNQLTNDDHITIIKIMELNFGKKIFLLDYFYLFKKILFNEETKTKLKTIDLSLITIASYFIENSLCDFNFLDKIIEYYNIDLYNHKKEYIFYISSLLSDSTKIYLLNKHPYPLIKFIKKKIYFFDQKIPIPQFEIKKTLSESLNIKNKKVIKLLNKSLWNEKKQTFNINLFNKISIIKEIKPNIDEQLLIPLFMESHDFFFFKATNLKQYLKRLPDKKVISFINKNIEFKQLDDLLTNFFKYNKTEKDIPIFSSSIELKEYLTFELIILTNKEFNLDIDPTCLLLDNTEWQEFSFKVPKTNIDLLIAAKKLSNCLGLYSNKKSLFLLLIYKDNKLFGCLEYNIKEKRIFQVLRKYNKSFDFNENEWIKHISKTYLIDLK